MSLNPFLSPDFEKHLDDLTRGPMTSNVEGVLIRPVDQMAAAIRELHDQLATVKADLVAAREDVARMRKQIADHEEAEASVCPEDVGFVEFIGVLQKRIAGLERALIGVTPSHRVKGKCWCPIAVDTGVTHSKACQAARTALAAQTTAAVEAVEGMRKALEAQVCGLCCNRIGWMGDLTQAQKFLGRGDWRTCVRCRDARAALAAYEEATRG